MGPAFRSPLQTVEAPAPPVRRGRVALVHDARNASEPKREVSCEKISVVAWARARGQELLFVDGDHFLLELTARAFRGVGAVCRTASTHAEALRILERDARIRAVILDYEIPDEDPDALVWRLDAIRPEVLVIGTSDRDRRREFVRRGVGLFVPKPWCFQDLVDATSR